MSILLLIEYSLEVANGKGFCKDLDNNYYRIGGSWECWEAAVGQRRIPQNCIAFSAFSIKEFGILGQKLRKEFRLSLGFALGRGCVGDQCGTQRSFYFRGSAQTLQHLQSPSAPLESPVGSPGNPGFPSSPFSPDVDHSSLTHTPDLLHILGISRETLKCPRTPQWTEGTAPTPH